jgi:hypothetical protein
MWGKPTRLCPDTYIRSIVYDFLTRAARRRIERQNAQREALRALRPNYARRLPGPLAAAIRGVSRLTKSAPLSEEP